MNQIISVVGVDPGPVAGTTGIAFIDYIGSQVAGKMLLQVDGESGQVALEAILAKYYSDPERIIKRFAGVEAFVPSKSAGSKGVNAEETRQRAFEFSQQLQMWGYHTKVRKKADVSSWASDKRLERAGLLRPPENRHANDAARHGLYCAVHDAYRPDPLR